MAEDVARDDTRAADVAPTLSILASQGLHEFVRYIAASAFALFIDIGLLWILTEYTNISYLIAGALSFTAGLVSIYLLSVCWVFGERSTRSKIAEFAIFSVVGLVGLGFNEIILYILTSIFGFYYLVSKIASVVVVFTWNFAARKWLLFRPHHG